MKYLIVLLSILALALTGCAKSEAVVEEPVKVQVASSEEETRTPLSNGGNSLDAMMLEDYKLPEIPDDKIYLVDNLILPSRQEVYYELPYDGYELPESTADSIITELAKLCIYKGYSKCSMVDAALDTGTINYRFKCDDTDWYNLYLYFESYNVLGVKTNIVKVILVGNKKHIESLVLAVQDLRFTLNDIASGMTTGNFAVPSDDFVTMRMEYMSLVSSLMEIIDASAYLFNAVVPQKSEVDKQKAQVMDMLNAIYSESEKTCHQEAQVPKTCQ